MGPDKRTHFRHLLKVFNHYYNYYNPRRPNQMHYVQVRLSYLAIPHLNLQYPNLGCSQNMQRLVQQMQHQPLSSLSTSFGDFVDLTHFLVVVRGRNEVGSSGLPGSSGGDSVVSPQQRTGHSSGLMAHCGGSSGSWPAARQHNRKANTAFAYMNNLC